MSDQSIQAYRDQVVEVAVRQWGGDLFTTSCETGSHAWRISDCGLFQECKWCDERRGMVCGECGQGVSDCATFGCTPDL